MSENKKKNAAIVLAAGQGKRMGTKTAKQFLDLHGRPVLYYALNAFERSEIDDIIIVTSESEIDYCQKEIVDKYHFSKVKAIVSGGKERYHSVAMGLLALKKREEESYEIVLIHDGARPLVTTRIIQNLIENTKMYGACVTATKMKDTVKLADQNGYCETTPPRERLWGVQTPQAFLFSLVLEAYEKLLREEDNLLSKHIQVTDDAMVVECMTNHKVKLVEGDYKNIKITTPEDLEIATLWLRTKES